MPTTLQTDCHADVDHVWEMFELTREPYYRNLLMDHYHHLVGVTAEHLHRRLPNGVELDDLISAGGFGLMAAVEAFDQARAIRFETYCVHRIRGAILDELRRTDWVPRSTRNRAQELSRAVQALEGRLGRRPSESEIAAELDMDAASFEKLRQSSPPRMISLDDIRNAHEDGEGMRWLDLVATKRAHEPCYRARRRELVRKLTHGLNRTEKLILVLYHCEELTMKEIGITLGLSESRVSQMHSLLLTRLRAKVAKQQATFSAMSLAS
jgi:RNA polymerase sigma factor for flagellar operon FliA